MRRYWAYLKVVLRHKYYVYKACRIMKVPWWIAVVHDWRKFLPREFIPYAHNFYNADGSKRTVRDKTGAYDPAAQANAFQLAWLDHQRARHHWQAWCVIGDGGKLSPMTMPEIFVRELVADWMGAGAAYDNYSPQGWYKANKDSLVVTPSTTMLIERLLQDEVPVENPF